MRVVLGLAAALVLAAAVAGAQSGQSAAPPAMLTYEVSQPGTGTIHGIAFDLCTASPDGANRERLVVDGASATWSPNGRFFAYQRDQGSTRTAYTDRMSSSGTPAARIRAT